MAVAQNAEAMPWANLAALLVANEHADYAATVDALGKLLVAQGVAQKCAKPILIRIAA